MDSHQAITQAREFQRHADEQGYGRPHNPNDAIQSLARLSEAAVRLMALMHRRDRAVDPNEEIAHMRANLDHVEQKVRRA